MEEIVASDRMLRHRGRTSGGVLFARAHGADMILSEPFAVGVAESILRDGIGVGERERIGVRPVRARGVLWSRFDLGGSDRGGAVRGYANTNKP